MPTRLSCGIVKVHRHNFIELVQLIRRKIIFCDRNVCFYNFSVRGIFPSCQSHVFFGMVCSCHDDFRSGVSMDGIVHLVLNRGKEVFCGFAVNRVIDGSGIDVGDFLVKSAFTGTNFLNFRNQVFKIVFIKNLAIDKAVFVQHITLTCKSIQYFSGPLPELCCARRVDTIAYGDNRWERIEFIMICSTVICNLCKICTSCGFI